MKVKTGSDKVQKNYDAGENLVDEKIDGGAEDLVGDISDSVGDSVEADRDTEDSADEDIDGDAEEDEDSIVEETPDKKVRLYEDYVIDDPEDMDEAPDTGDMFDDDYDDYEDYDSRSYMKAKRKKQKRVYGPKGSTLAILWVLFVVMVCGYVYVFHINTTILAGVIGEHASTTKIQVPEGANYSVCSIDEINQLIDNYLLARANADQATLQRLVTDPSEFNDMESVKFTAQYITAYNRTTCYMVMGATQGTFVIYAISNLVIKDVNCEPLDIRTFYVEKQGDGVYKIDNAKWPENVAGYVDEVTASSYVQGLYKYVKDNTDYLLSTNESFKKFQEMYN